MLDQSSNELCPIGHFRVHHILHFKVRLSAKSLLWKSVFIHIEIRTSYHDKNFALRLALKERLRGTRERPIVRLFSSWTVIYLDTDCLNLRVFQAITMPSWVIWRKMKLTGKMSIFMLVSLSWDTFSAVICWGKVSFLKDFAVTFRISDRDYKGSSDDDDEETPKISLQEMLEDLHLDEPDSAAMLTE